MIFIFVFFITTITSAQNTDVDELVVRRVADYILEHGELSFKDVNTGKIYKSTKNVPENAVLKLSNPFGEWHYTNGVLHLGFLELAQHMNNSTYKDFVLKN